MRRQAWAGAGLAWLAASAATGCMIRHWESYNPATLHQIDIPDGRRGPRVVLDLDDGQQIAGNLVDVDLDTRTVIVAVKRDGAAMEAVVSLDAIVGATVGEVDVPLTVLATSGAVIGISAGAWLILVLIILLTKDSCPIVYVEGPDGLVLVGEGYSGAVAASLKRPDRLALPDLDGTVHVRLVDEAHETQLTDAAWLVVVDTPAGARALPTLTGETRLVGAPIVPTRVVDLHGDRDLLPLVGADDRAAWATDMDRAAADPDAPTEEGLVASLDAAPPRAALELVIANQPWVDLVAGRIWASLGAQHEAVQAKQADPEARVRLEQRLKDAGIYTAVEVRTAAGWQTVTWLVPPGWVKPRRLVVPLDVPEGEPLEVRLRGSVGFLAIDQIGFTTVLDDAPAEVRLLPRAVQSDGADVSAALAAVDGQAQVLPDLGAYVDLTWDLPPATGDRALFLHLDGYYLVHPKPNAKLDLRLASLLATHPEDTGQVSLDLYRELFATLAAAPNRSNARAAPNRAQP